MIRPVHLMFGTMLCVVLMAIPGAQGQAGTGPLAGLQEATTKVGFDDEMPPKLSGLLWPTPGVVPKKCAVRKVGVEGKSEDDKRMLIARVDNGDIVFAHIITSKPEAGTKVRREYYYRANAGGNLALALTATFQFTISDVDNDVLKNVTSQTYGETTGDGTQPLAITPEITARFETEKKFWLKQQKDLKKKEKDSGQ
jgi:hypothetical protein